jgi:hypothetical protein
MLGAFLMKQLYFNNHFEFTNTTKVLMGANLLVTLMLIPRYFYLREQGATWWAPVVLEIIVSHILIYAQMAIEYFTWNNKKIKWQKELMFHQQFKK